ncbi:MAG: metallophosphoesterase family protein [Candidatus Nanoarchaeia archaeon]|nr:metallophosphoesterase [Candidatus Haiyanarchaeum thermophilum]MCW1302993.1 metallophosphoesterase [Candidatus Haiyanarchaeum thermophilum]MCW1303671.1 metallophosphoesterase [Candidatus Haiyanarchaeum thermophilum]MCW1306351.1 metallophosphoesterase [Candidatus Haiyanarchaeum thermophilum]MCW1307139.1 metallophosphoesterase [Candidatus Haiyanarchaeum thermophilum]
MGEVKLLKNFKPNKEGGKLIGLISDTHIPTRASFIPQKVFEIFSSVDLIIHAGDLVELSVIDELRKNAAVIAVCGNMDLEEVVETLPKINSIEVEGYKIGVVHDAGIMGTEKMKNIAETHEFDILVFGHTHRQFLLKEGKRLFINPGSATNPLPPLITKPSIALLRISEKRVEPFFIQV